MVYILIVLWFGTHSSTGKAALAVEFNNIESCRAAADEIRRQADSYSKLGAVLCAAKGKP
jgi:hypothetical protein